MGLYSNTRVSALNEYASAEFKRGTNIQSLIEACVEIRENDYKMFESLLNLDFAEASMLKEEYYEDLAKSEREKNAKADAETAKKNSDAAAAKKAAEAKREENDTVKADAVEGNTAKSEKDLSGNHHVFSDTEEKIEAANESKVKKIWEKIVAFFQGIIDKIKTFFAKVIAKIREVIGRDKAISEKYKDAFTAEKMKGFEGLADISVPRLSPEKMKDTTKEYLDKFSGEFDKVLDQISSASSKDKVQAAVDNFQNETEDTGAYNILSKEGVANTFFDKYTGEKKFVPTPDFMKVALESINARSKVLEAIEKMAKDFDEKLNKKKADLKKKEAELKGKKDELGLAKASASFKLAQGFSTAATKIANEFVNAATKAFGSYRKLVLIVGKYALKDKSKKEAKNESAMMDFAIAEASDLYIAESLGF